jgi:hypothetical protein
LTKRAALYDGGGLGREELESGREWGSTVRRWARCKARELHRCNGLAKMLEAIACYLAARVVVMDRRALAAIARDKGIRQRQARASLRELERRRILVRVFRAGVRLPGQRGWETSAIVAPELVPFVALMPPAAQRRARAELAAFALRDPAVRAMLGNAPATQPAAPGTPIEPPPAPPPPPCAPAPVAPDLAPPVFAATAEGSPPENRQTSTDMGSIVSPSVIDSDPHRIRDHDRPPLPPRRLRVVDGGSGGAVAPSPRDPSAAATGGSSSGGTAPPAGGERPRAPRPGSASPATSGGELERASAPPATCGPGAASSRREVWPTLPAELRGPHAAVRDVIAWYEAQGVPRSKAIAHVRAWQGAHFARRRRELAGEDPGRRPRLRTAARELEAVRWDVVRAAWAHAAAGPAWLEILAAIRFVRIEPGRGDELAIVLEAPPAVARVLERERDRLDELAGDALERRRVRMHVGVRNGA